jgi:hypothetical protein
VECVRSRVDEREGGIEVHGVRAGVRRVQVRYAAQGRGHRGVSMGGQAEERGCRRGGMGCERRGEARRGRGGQGPGRRFPGESGEGNRLPPSPWCCARNLSLRIEVFPFDPLSISGEPIAETV